MLNKFKEYQLDLCEVENSSIQKISSKRFWYKHIKKNALKNDGDILEFGVYRGRSLLTAALLLKQLGSKKKLYGFDSFKGFPSKTKFDDLKNFKNKKYFNKKFQNDYKKFIQLKKILNNKKKFTPFNIASSGDFSHSSKQHILEKVKYLKLDNIVLIEGDFAKTVPNFFKSNKIKISSCNIDSDLYASYKITLPYIYNYLSKNGYIFLDEYYSLKYPGAKIATDKFCKQQKIKPKKHIVRPGEFERWYLTK